MHRLTHRRYKLKRRTQIQTETPTTFRRLCDLNSTREHTFHWFWQAEFNTERPNWRFISKMNFLKNSFWRNVFDPSSVKQRKCIILVEQEVKKWSWTNESYLTVLRTCESICFVVVRSPPFSSKWDEYLGAITPFIRDFEGNYLLYIWSI